MTELGLKRDLTVLGVMIIVLVSFTLSWNTGDLGTEWTADAVQYSESPVAVSSSTNFVISNYRFVTLTVVLNNTSTVSQDIEVEVQPLDEEGDIVSNSTTTLDTQTESLTIAAGDVETLVFTFEFDHIDRYLEEFIIAITGPGYVMTWSLSSNGSSEATLAIVGYCTTSGTPSVPKVQLYDPPWTSQTLLSTGYYVHQVQTAFNPNWKSRFEIIAVVLGTYSSSSSQFWLYAYVYDGVEWSEPEYLGTGTGWNSYPQACPFDVIYETTSSNAIVVWNNKYESNNVRDLAYKIWDGISWGDGTTYGSIGYLNTLLSGETDAVDDFSYIRLEANPTADSNQITLMGLTKATKPLVKCFVWSGSSWGNGLGLCTSSNQATTASYQCFDVAYEYSTGTAVVVAANNKVIRYASFTTSWSIIQTLSGGISNNINWLVLKSHNVGSSDKLMLISLDSGRDGKDVYTRVRSGSSWSTPTLIDDEMEIDTTRCVDGDWLPSGTTFLLVGGNKDTDEISYKTWTTSGWSPSTSNSWNTVSISGVTDQRWVQVRTNLKNETPLMVIGVVDDVSTTDADLTIMYWTGSTIAIYSEFTSYSSYNYEGFSIACSFP